MFWIILDLKKKEIIPVERSREKDIRTFDPWHGFVSAKTFFQGSANSRKDWCHENAESTRVLS